MRITKKVREDAALILALVASNHNRLNLMADAAEWIGIGRDDPACRLARCAFHDEAVPSRNVAAQTYADAESLLRSGWSPGDEP